MSRRRLLWLVIILIVLALYFPVNRLAHGGVQLSLSVDKLIPLYPPAVVPYLLGDILFIGFPIWAALRVKPGEFEAYAVSILFATLMHHDFYKKFYRYHGYLWLVFWASVTVHVIFAVNFIHWPF